jgi:hypothetical protein
MLEVESLVRNEPAANKKKVEKFGTPLVTTGHQS